MISMEASLSPLQTRNPLPKPEQLSQNPDMVQAAEGFTSVFLTDYVSFMLEEVEKEDDEFSTQAFSGVYAKALADQITHSKVGQAISNSVLADLTRMQATQGGDAK